MSNVAMKFSHTGPSQGALPLAGRGRRIMIIFLFFETFFPIGEVKTLAFSRWVFAVSSEVAKWVTKRMRVLRIGVFARVLLVCSGAKGLSK